VTLTKPDHLHGDEPWLARHAAGVAALGLGILAFVVVAVSQDQLWSTPDPKISVPAFGVTAAAAVVSLARRERAYSLVLAALGLAGAALVLGWFVMLAIIVGASAALILILHSVM
jgi:uncharacterized membrane protein YccC